MATANQATVSPGRAPKAALLMRVARTKAFRWLIVRMIVPVLDILLAPLVVACALLMKSIRRVGVYRMTLSRSIFFRVGVFPIRDHYYEPLFNPARLRRPLDQDRALPGIDFNVEEQLEWLRKFTFAGELVRFPVTAVGAHQYQYDNPNFSRGDAEYFYSLIRLVKPRRIVEVGSGFSTLVAREAITANLMENEAYRCRHVCIEPYEMAWLEELGGVEIVRGVVEEMDRSLFASLEADDMLFIDSSHMIRPQGDVVCEHLEILPTLKRGVFVHVHDIFTPRDYPALWVKDQVRFWNEQYLVQAFLSGNRDFKIVGALNFLKHHHADEIKASFPVLAAEFDACEPASLWIVRR